jgi:putative Ig domain-containing protein
MKSFVLVLALCCVTALLPGCGSSSHHNGPPTLPTAASLPSTCTAAIVGTAYTCTITASGGTAPFKWTVTGLPTGLSSNASTDTGSSLTISGTPQAASAATSHTASRRAPSRITPADGGSTSNIQVSVADATGATASLTFGVTVSPPPALAITTTSLAEGNAGAAYTASITGSGGVTPYTWTATGLPSGLSLSSGTPSATISGTTDNVGTFSVKATVTDSESSAVSVSSTLSLTIAQASAITITTTSLPNGTENISYSQTLSATGGVTPYIWTLTSGTLPTGFSLSTAGVISGTPTAAGSFSFAVQVTDAEVPPQTATQGFGITINTPTSGLNITTASPLSGATQNSAYTTSVTASGGTPPYTWSLGSGSALPAGLSLTSGTPNATISGTPTATGTFKFTLDVKDSASSPATASASFLLTVTGSSAFTCPTTWNPLQSLCGTNFVEVEGSRSAGALYAEMLMFLADNSGNVISGEEFIEESNGYSTHAVTGGSYAMDSNSDGRGVLTIIHSTAAVETFRFVNHSAANYKPGPIEEFDSTGALVNGIIATVPTTSPLPQIPGSTVVGVQLNGVNGAGKPVGLLGSFEVGSNGCDGTTGSFSSAAGETIVVNSGGTVTTGLTATGSCTAADALGVGTAEITLSGGTPFTNNTLNFFYFEYTNGGALNLALFLGKDALAANQPVLGGPVLPNSLAGQVTNSAFASYCSPACVAQENGTTSTGNPDKAIARFFTTAGSGNTGTLFGFFDENAGGTITGGEANWPYTVYTVDSNGSGAFTGSGQATIHFVYTDKGLYLLDESAQVRTGTFDQQNSDTVEDVGSPYVFGGSSGSSTTSTQFVGFVTPTGTSTSGTIPGTVDVISNAGLFPGVAASGTYGSFDLATGHGTGTANLANGSTVNTIIQVARHRRFFILDMQSTTPYLVDVSEQ